ncbi:Rpn family recombination-promoting nuclease/putative transposase, partial [Rickettsiales endosymbiont of Peranema trichophorum]|uniref:Rpn family recombination-promoting nuclease/putative transposase n=1 Tax=Rickettsiales endosymbiont of Peranema trichophorum TaxID=2486577 RepID=UPI001022FA11
MTRYLDATNDVAFKRVFGDKERLKDFLNAILRLEPGEKIAELNFMSGEEIPDIGQGKRSLFDLKCKDEAGKTYIVEMENRQESHYIQRAQFYGSHTYVSQLKKGMFHKDLLPVIVVSIMKNKKLFGDNIGCISYHTTREEKTNERHLFALSYVFVELPKFKKGEDELSGIEDEWLFFLSRSEEVKEPPIGTKDEHILEAYRELERFNWSEESYDAYIRARLLLDGQECTIDDVRKEGESKGLEKGIAIGT